MVSAPVIIRLLRSRIAAWILLATSSAFVSNPATAHWQESGDRARGLWDKTFESERTRTRKKRPRPPASQDAIARALIGVTIWRLPDAAPESTSQRSRSLVHRPESTAHRLAERVETHTVFREGDRIRIGVEAPHVGFLYVIDREVYSDGSLGDPFLIFPTKHTRRGDNRVYPGRLIEIPAQTDRPPYFTFERTRRELVSERLTIIVSPFRLAIETRSEDGKLESSLVTKWETLWSSSIEHREAPGNAGKRRTRAEQEALEGKRLLARDDPLPQTIFRATVRPGLPLLITLPLRIAP